MSPVCAGGHVLVLIPPFGEIHEKSTITEGRRHFPRGVLRVLFAGLLPLPHTAKSVRSCGVAGCHLDTPAILQESPSFLVLIDIDIAVRIYPDGVAAINLAGPCRTHPPGYDLPIDRKEGD